MIRVRQLRLDLSRKLLRRSLLARGSVLDLFNLDVLVVRALKISQLTDDGMPPTYDSMHHFC
jgi:hypothetical protein